MKRDCSTCICKEGSCYPSTTIFDKDKTCKSYDPDYEGYIADLEKENERLTVSYETLKLHDEEEIGMLKSENAELKDDNKVMADNYSKMEQKFFDNLTKAKELLKRYVPYRQITDSKAYKDLAEETEQFLSEVEK